MSNSLLTKSVRFSSAEQRFIGALGIAQICSWGSLYYGFPLIAEAMSTEFGWTKPSVMDVELWRLGQSWQVYSY
jgi:hypothetical protein